MGDTRLGAFAAVAPAGQGGGEALLGHDPSSRASTTHASKSNSELKMSRSSSRPPSWAAVLGELGSATSSIAQAAYTPPPCTHSADGGAGAGQLVRTSAADPGLAPCSTGIRTLRSNLRTVKSCARLLAACAKSIRICRPLGARNSPACCSVQPAFHGCALGLSGKGSTHRHPPAPAPSADPGPRVCCTAGPVAAEPRRACLRVCERPCVHC